MITKAQAVAAGQRTTVIHHTGLGPCTVDRIQKYKSWSRCKTWVTRPNEFKLSVRLGLVHGTIRHSNADEWHLEEDCPLRRGGSSLPGLIGGQG